MVYSRRRNLSNTGEIIDSAVSSICLATLIYVILQRFGKHIYTVYDIVLFMEIEYEEILTMKDFKRLIKKGAINADDIKHRLPSKEKDRTERICSILDSKKWIGK